MNEFVIRILKKIQNYMEKSSVDTNDNGANIIQEKKNGMITRVIVGLFSVGIYLCLLLLIVENFSRYYGVTLSGYYYGYVLGFIFILIQTLLCIYMIARIKKNDCKIIPLLYTIYFPLLFCSFGIVIIITPSNIEGDTFRLALSIPVIFYPILQILSSFFKKLESTWILGVKNFFLSYNLGFFFLLSLNIALISIGWDLDFFKPWTSSIIEINSYNHSFGLLEGLFYIISCAFLLTSGVFSLNSYFREARKSRKSLHVGLMAILCVFLLSLIPQSMDRFYEMQIGRAGEIIIREGNNFTGYTNAHVFMLDRAFYSKIKNREYINRTLFQKLYDSTPEEYFGESIANYTDSRTSFGTNASNIGEKAKVILSLAEIENRVQTGSLFQILETTYRFNFVNSSDTNQEVIIDFEAPTKYSVISSLKLGLDLEIIGQIAPKGAARKVYEDSLRRNTDPALIEKVGMSSYNLRVFPIPSKQDQKRQGRQLVEVKILTPILSEKQNIAYTPKFSFINLKFDEHSGIVSKIYNNSSIIKEDTIKKEDIEAFLSNEHFMEFSSTRNYSLGEMCQETSEIIMPSVSNTHSGNIKRDKISVLFDNSLSVERNKSQIYYEGIYKGIKNFGNILHDVDLYAYNFDVNKVVSPADIKFYGYSDIDRTIEYIIKNKIVNQRIILVTDDESFNLSTIENKALDYNSLMSNQISVIKIGGKIKSYKSEMNNILSATNGNIYQVTSMDDINPVIAKIYGTSGGEELSVKGCSGEIYDQNSRKIQAGYISNALLSNIQSEADWQRIAEIQTIIAKKYNIVNQFNSYIALETIKQQQDLDRYSKEESRYDAPYRNDDGDGSISNNDRPRLNGLEFRSVERSSMNKDMFSERSVPVSTGINFGQTKMTQSIQGVSRSDKYDPREMSEFNGKIELNFLGLLMFLIYLVEFYGLVAFVVNYIKGDQKAKI